MAAVAESGNEIEIRIDPPAAGSEVDVNEQQVAVSAASSNSSNQADEENMAADDNCNTDTGATDDRFFLSKSLYEAAEHGNIDAFIDYEDRLDKLRTRNNSTIVHIYLLASPSWLFEEVKDSSTSWFHHDWISSKFADLLLMRKLIKGKEQTPYHKTAALSNRTAKFLKWVPNHLLWEANENGETPLHIAARCGLLRIAAFLTIMYEIIAVPDRGWEENILKRNKWGYTALHEAVRHNHDALVRFFMMEYQILHDYKDFEEAATRQEKEDRETPLYLAAEREFESVVDVILNQSDNLLPPHSGPNGRTALHAAVLRKNGVITELLLGHAKTRIALPGKPDDGGWIPLHYAAYYGYSGIVQQFLKHDQSLAYKRTDKEEIALHLAAARGEVKAMEMLIYHSPDCWELVDKRGWNVLHFAVDSKCKEAVEVILKEPWLIHVVNQQNDNGDTPLHLLAESGTDMRHFIDHPLVDKLACNKENLSALEVLLAKGDLWGQQKKVERRLEKYGLVRRNNNQDGQGDDGGDMRDEKKAKETTKNGDAAINPKSQQKSKDDIIDYIKEAKEAHLVVAALIATVTFAAGFTLPGGYKGDGSADEGGAILTRRRAFQAFMITDTIAMVLSSSAVYIHLIIALNENKAIVYSQFKWVLYLNVLAMFTMVLAFVTGTYAVLRHSRELAISISTLGCMFFMLYVVVPGKRHLSDKIEKKPRKEAKNEVKRDAWKEFEMLNNKNDKVTEDIVDGKFLVDV